VAVHNPQGLALHKKKTAFQRKGTKEKTRGLVPGVGFWGTKNAKTGVGCLW